MIDSLVVELSLHVNARDDGTEGRADWPERTKGSGRERRALRILVAVDQSVRGVHPIEVVVLNTVATTTLPH